MTYLKIDFIKLVFTFNIYNSYKINNFALSIKFINECTIDDRIDLKNESVQLSFF